MYNWCARDSNKKRDSVAYILMKGKKLIAYIVTCTQQFIHCFEGALQELCN